MRGRIINNFPFSILKMAAELSSQQDDFSLTAEKKGCQSGRKYFDRLLFFCAENFRLRSRNFPVPKKKSCKISSLAFSDSFLVCFWLLNNIPGEIIESALKPNGPEYQQKGAIEFRTRPKKFFFKLSLLSFHTPRSLFLLTSLSRPCIFIFGL